jgi:hypothetical protein
VTDTYLPGFASWLPALPFGFGDGLLGGKSGAALIIAAVVGYLLGSIPFGFLLTRAAGLGDIRDIGSGGTGATNVLRTGNKKLAGPCPRPAACQPRRCRS